MKGELLIHSTIVGYRSQDPASTKAQLSITVEQYSHAWVLGMAGSRSANPILRLELLSLFIS